MLEPLTRDEAVTFFAHFLRGRHHIPRNLKAWGDGWCITVYNGLSTYDFYELTRLVFMAHDYGYRVEVSPAMRHLRIAISRRAREGMIYEYHLMLEQAVENWRKYNPIREDEPMIAAPVAKE